MKKRLSAAMLALLFTFPAGVYGETTGNEAEVQQEVQTDTPSVPQEDLVYVNDGEVSVVSDCEVLNFPGRKDGEVVGELLASDTVRHTAILTGGWSLIAFTGENGQELSGYVPTESLDVPGETQEEALETENSGDAANDPGTENVEAGILSPSKGDGIFAQAAETITADGVTVVDGVQVGTPSAASSDAALIPLGTFRITHYCSCSICCGPWANGITSTGVTATTNRTIAVDPSQIPYGSKVVINGQVYVAEDCGGAIKTNCIDIYVASHPEGENKGVYYTDVYLVQE